MILIRQNTEVKAGDVLRHVFSYRADLSSVSYVVVYFNKMKNCESCKNFVSIHLVFV